MSRQGFLVMFLVVLSVLAALALGNPETDGWFLKCPFYQLTHWQCPLCGAQRALHSFFHGEWRAAWAYNPALWLLIPYVVLRCAALVPCWQSSQWSRAVQSDRLLLLVAVGLLGWGIVRNFF